MAEATNFKQNIARIGDLMRQMEAAEDAALRAASRELVQLLMELQGAALEKMMEIAFQSGEGGASIIDDFGREPLVSSLLILHGLHPESVEERVSRALERIAPQLRKHGSRVEVLGMEAGAVRLRIETGEHACGSTAGAVQAIVEEAISETAPDIVSLGIEVTGGKAASGFVSVDALLGSPKNAVLATAENGGD